MDRKHLYRTASKTVDVLRTRVRKEHCGLRKEKRDKILSLKRLRYAENCEDSDSIEFTVEDVISLSRIIQTHDSNILDILKKLKRVFTHSSAFADTFIAQDGALQCLVKYLAGKETGLQSEAAWCLTNLAGSTQDHAVLILKTCGAYLITYLGGQNVLLQDLSAWTLGNLAGDCEECRRIMRDQGAIDPLVYLLKSSFSNVVQSAAFAICNITRSSYAKIWEDLKKSGIGTTLYKLFRTASEEVITELTWILMNFCVNSDNLEYLYSCGINVTFLVELLAKCLEFSESIQVVTPLIRILGNICSGPDQFGEEALNTGSLLKAMTSLLTSFSSHVRKESLWLLSNLTAGSRRSVMSVIEAGLLPILVEMLDDDYFDIQKESATVLLNITYKNVEFLQEVLKIGAMKKFLQLLKSRQNELTLLALQFFENMLRTCPESREVFEKVDGVAQLEALQYSGSSDVNRCVNDLIDNYFE